VAILVAAAVAVEARITDAPAGPVVDAHRSVGRRARFAHAELTVTSRARMTSVPKSFLGISTEYWSLPLFERHVWLFGRALSLVHAQDDGPLILRIGGDSADSTFWEPAVRRMPHWVFQLTPHWLGLTRSLVQRGGVRLILDLNLVTDTPLKAAELAAAAERELPRGSIVAFEIGNEPDLYTHSYWASIVHGTLPGHVLPPGISAETYALAYESFAKVLARLAPSAPLVGPALGNPFYDASWISHLLSAPHPRLGIVSGHRYQYSGCAARSSRSYPTIARLLSEHATAGTAQTLTPAVRFAHRAGLPFRLTELNSVTCGGLAGVSNTFATALWAPDALFELLHAHVDGVNVHVRSNRINAAFALTRGGLQARPLLYGLILFVRTLAAQPRTVDLRLRAAPSLHLKAWAVRSAGGVLHVLLIDKGSSAIRVGLGLPVTGPATVQRLLAPSVGSRSDVTLGGQQLGADGRWHGRPTTETVAAGSRGYELTIPPLSAALVSAHLRPGALAPSAARAHR
jgi:hypothetical protein